MARTSKSKNDPQPEVRHAEAITTVHKYEPTVYDKPREGPALAKLHLEESFHGDIEGDGIVECLQVTNVDGSASLVGIERVAGKIANREGTFLLQVTATVKDKMMSAEWFVVSESGTAQLAGLRGKGGFRAHLGQSGQVHLDYWFE